MHQYGTISRPRVRLYFEHIIRVKTNVIPNDEDNIVSNVCIIFIIVDARYCFI